MFYYAVFGFATLLHTSPLFLFPRHIFFSKSAPFRSRTHHCHRIRICIHVALTCAVYIGRVSRDTVSLFSKESLIWQSALTGGTLSFGSLFAIHFGNEALLIVQLGPDHWLVLLERLLNVDDPLITGSAKLQ